MASFLTCPIWVFISLCWCVGVGAVFAAAQPTHFSLFGEKLCTSCHSRKRFASFRPRRKRHAHTHTEATCLFAIVLWQARSSWRRLDTHAHTHTHTHISIQIVSCQINKDRQWAGQVRLLLLLSCMCVCVPGMYARVRALLLNHLWLTVAISGNEVGREVTTIESISIHRLHYAHPAAPSLSFLFLLFCQFYLIGFASGHS